MLAGLCLLLAAASPPEIVALPLSTGDENAQEGLEAWTVVIDGLDKAKKKLKVSTAVQKKQHDFLIGPVREQAKDCADNLACYAEIGSALGAQYLVVGRVDGAGVALRTIDVASKSAIAEGGSMPAIAKQPAKKKAQAAIKSLVGAFSAYQKKKPEPEKKDPEPAVAVKEPSGETGATSSGVSGAAPLLVVGKIQVNKDQLGGVTRVTIDGEAAPFGGDGNVNWSGPPGSHRLTATRADGNVFTKEIIVDPGKTVFASLEFAIVSTPPPLVATKEETGGGVTSKWWFWTSIGVAVAAGATSAIVLAGGDKGGPELPDQTGTIRGSY